MRFGVGVRGMCNIDVVLIHVEMQRAIPNERGRSKISDINLPNGIINSSKEGEKKGPKTHGNSSKLSHDTFQSPFIFFQQHVQLFILEL